MSIDALVDRMKSGGLSKADLFTQLDAMNLSAADQQPPPAPADDEHGDGAAAAADAHAAASPSASAQHDDADAAVPPPPTDGDGAGGGGDGGADLAAEPLPPQPDAHDGDAYDDARAAAADDTAAAADGGGGGAYSGDAVDADASAYADVAAAAAASSHTAAAGDDARDAVPLSQASVPADGNAGGAVLYAPDSGSSGAGGYHPMSSSERRRLVEELFAQKKQQLAAARRGGGGAAVGADAASPAARGRARVAAWDDGTPTMAGGGRAVPRTEPRNSRSPRPAAAVSAPATDKRYRKSTDQLAREIERDKYTFKPKVNPLPDMYRAYSGLDAAGGGGGRHDAGAGADGDANANAAGGNAEQFAMRATQWRDGVNSRNAQLRTALKDEDMTECTFQPLINPTSLELVRMSGDARRKTFTERSMARARAVELELKRQTEDEFRAECTFEPRINTRSRQMVDSLRTGQAASAAGDDTEPAAAAPATPDRIEQLHTGSGGVRRASTTAPAGSEFSFTPNTNRVAPYMAAAQVYLEQNAFQRLYSKPKSKAELDAAATAAYASRASATAASASAAASSGSSATRTRSPIRASASAGRGGAAAPADDSDGDADVGRHSDEPPAGVSTAASLEDFLARQNGTLARKQHRVKQLLAQTAPRGKPQLNKRSHVLVARSTRAATGPSFVERLAHSEQRKKSWVDERATAMRVLIDEECTFTPLITQSAHQLKARTPSELSVGDAARKLTKLEIARIAARQKEMVGVTFKPATASAAAAAAVPSASSAAAAAATPSAAAAGGDAGSVLRVTTEPHTYTERVANQRRAQDLKRALTQQIRAEQEMRECTFRPVVHDSPAYVKAIAAQVKATKLVDAANRPPPSPQWK